MSNASRRAMTLVELLAVMGVLTILMALLLPAVGYVRESSRRTACMNRQRQIGLGLMTHEASAQHFTGHYNLVGGKPTSWVVPTLPHVEQQAVFDAWSAGEHLMPRLELIVCPSDDDDEFDLAPLSYTVNAGILDSQSYLDVAANGVFHNHADRRRAVFVGLGDISGADGASQTLLLSENKQASEWAGDGGRFTTDARGRRIVAADGFYENPVVCEAHTTFVWIDPDWAESEEQFRSWHINQDRWGFETGLQVSPDQSRPTSNHPGGVVATMADGHVVFLRDSLDYWVYVALMTPDGQHARVPNLSGDGGDPLKPLTALIPGTQTPYTGYVLRGDEAP